LLTSFEELSPRFGALPPGGVALLELALETPDASLEPRHPRERFSLGR